MMRMQTKKDGKKRTQQICVRVTDDEMLTLDSVIESVVRRSNGLAEPNKSDVVLELMGFSPSRFISDAERQFVKQRMESGHADAIEGKKESVS